MYRQGRNYENLNKGIFDGTGTYGIPHLFTEQVTADSFIGRSEEHTSELQSP